jgi:hypothetical protein
MEQLTLADKRAITSRVRKYDYNKAMKFVERTHMLQQYSACIDYARTVLLRRVCRDTRVTQTISLTTCPEHVRNAILRYAQRHARVVHVVYTTCTTQRTRYSVQRGALYYRVKFTDGTRAWMRACDKYLRKT